MPRRDREEAKDGHDGRRRRPSKLTVALFVLVVVIGVAAVFLDYGELIDTVRAADFEIVALALVASAVSYLALSGAFAWMSQLLGIGVETRRLITVGFIAAALNNVVAAGGVAGHSARVALLREDGESAGDALAASAFHSYTSSFVLLALLPVGLVHLMLTGGLPTAAVVPLAIMTGVAVTLLALASWVVFHGDLRQAIVKKIIGLIERFSKKSPGRRLLSDFDETMDKGTKLVVKRPRAFGGAVGLDLADWTMTALTLDLCFWAFGEPLPMGVLLTGMVVGIAAGLMSAIPAGIGVLEASMTGVYALLGVPFEVAILAALVFRVVYHVVPFVVALVLYARLIQKPVRSLVGGRGALLKGQDE